MSAQGAWPLEGRAPARGRLLAERRGVAHALCPPATRFIDARRQAGDRHGGAAVGLVVLLRAVRPLPTSASGNGSLAQCLPEQFHCSEPYDPQTDCYPLEWLCDGHPDCDDGRDEWSCGTNWSTAVPTAGGTEASAVPSPRHALPSRNHGRMWMLIVAGIFHCEVVRWD
ncbi:CD320 antigen isoform X2 [Meleagris gallopavo]|uniref:CD320 antigen isoform X2 n=1 Tax=Meleagris gallopavo TaxID=9103 RepID=UPI0005499782|nr:CD320 antigen isoform X2 [Meleagris gallopavo]